VTAGAIPAMLLAMENHSNEASVQERGCMALQNLAAEADFRQKIASEGGIQAILSAMKDHLGEGRVQLQGCAALRNLGLGSSQNISIMSSSGGLMVLVETIRHNRTDPRVVEQAFRTLRNLAKDSADNRVALAGALPGMIEVMKEHTLNESVQRETCATLRNLSVTEDIQLTIAAVGGVDTVVNTMREHPKSERVQTQACGVLYNLSCCVSNLAMMKKDKHCKAVLKNAAKRYPENCGRYANKLLDRMASCPKGQAPTPVLDLVDGKATPQPDPDAKPEPSSMVILRHIHLLRTNADTLTEQEGVKAISELGLLARGESLTRGQGHQVAIVAADGIHAIISFMTGRASSQLIQHTSCEALQILCNQNPDGCNAMREAGGVQAVVAAMSMFLKQAEMQVAGCTVFQTILAEEESGFEFGHAMHKSGGLRAIARAMKVHKKYDQVQEDACKVLSGLSGLNQSACVEIANSGCVPRVVSALKAHPQSAGVQLSGCQVLYNLSFNPILVKIIRAEKPEAALQNAAGVFPLQCRKLCEHIMGQLLR